VPIRLDDERSAILDAALPGLVAFKRAFGRDISADFIAELYAARELNLQLPDSGYGRGADATDASGRRYQIKCRQPGTQNVDLNNFEFDVLVLVNLDESYALGGMWTLPVEQVKELSVSREKFRKFQVTQDRLKRAATRVK
jgi:hypothetical protein